MRRRSANPFATRNDAGPTGISFSANPDIQKSQPRTILSPNETGPLSVPVGTTPKRNKPDEQPEKQSSLALLTSLAASRGLEAGTAGSASSADHLSNLRMMDRQYSSSQGIATDGSRFEQYTRRSQKQFAETLGHPQAATKQNVSPSWAGRKTAPLQEARPLTLHERQMSQSQQHHDAAQTLKLAMMQQPHELASAGGHHMYSSSLQHRSPYASSSIMSRSLGLESPGWSTQQQPNEEESQQALLRAAAGLPPQAGGDGRIPALQTAMPTTTAAAYSSSYPTDVSYLQTKPMPAFYSDGTRVETGASLLKPVRGTPTKDKPKGASNASRRSSTAVREQGNKLGLEEHTYVVDYAAGLVLRHGVLLPLLKSGRYNGGNARVSMALELGKYFRGECVLLRRETKDKHKKIIGVFEGAEEAEEDSDKDSTNNKAAKARSSLISSFVDNVSASDADIIRSWYHNSVGENGGDSYLLYSSGQWSDAWVKRCVSDSRTHGNREVIKLVSYLEQEGSGEEEAKKLSEVIVGVAYIERYGEMENDKSYENARTSTPALIEKNHAETSNDKRGQKAHDQGTTRILGIRIAPDCNPEVRERFSWCSNAVMSPKNDAESVTPPFAVDRVDVLSALYHHILHRSLLYGTSGVTVHSPKDAFFEQFYRARMGKPLGRDKDGKFVFSIHSQHRLKAVRNGFEGYFTLVREAEKKRRGGDLSKSKDAGSTTEEDGKRNGASENETEQPGDGDMESDRSGDKRSNIGHSEGNDEPETKRRRTMPDGKESDHSTAPKKMIRHRLLQQGFQLGGNEGKEMSGYSDPHDDNNIQREKIRRSDASSALLRIVSTGQHGTEQREKVP